MNDIEKKLKIEILQEACRDMNGKVYHLLPDFLEDLEIEIIEKKRTDVFEVIKSSKNSLHDSIADDVFDMFFLKPLNELMDKKVVKKMTAEWNIIDDKQ